jgi:hypothetical protein
MGGASALRRRDEHIPRGFSVNWCEPWNTHCAKPLSRGTGRWVVSIFREELSPVLLRECYVRRSLARLPKSLCSHSPVRRLRLSISTQPRRKTATPSRRFPRRAAYILRAHPTDMVPHPPLRHSSLALAAPPRSPPPHSPRTLPQLRPQPPLQPQRHLPRMRQTHRSPRTATHLITRLRLRPPSRCS